MKNSFYTFFNKNIQKNSIKNYKKEQQLKGDVLKLIKDLGVSNPTSIEEIKDKNFNKIRFYWDLLGEDELFLDLLPNGEINYMANKYGEDIKIYTLKNLDELEVILLKYLL